MPGEIFATQSLDELARLRERDEQPELAPRSAPRTPDLAGVSNTLAEKSDMVSDAGSEQPGISPPTSPPRRRITAARPPVGILLYLVSSGLVATVIIVLCFGVGFFLFARGAAPVLGETEMPGSAAAAALPVVPPAERPALGEAAPPRESNVTRLSEPVSSIGESSAGGATNIAPAQTGSTPEPAATSSASAAPASPRPSVAEIPQLPANAMHRPTRARASDHLGTMSPIPHPPSDPTPGAAHATAGRARSANQNGKVDHDEGAARRQNQREYEQLQGVERAADQ